MMDLTTCEAPASAKTSLSPSLQGGSWTWEQKDREGSCRPRQAAGVPNSRLHSPSRAPSEPSPSRGCRATPKEWPCVGGGIFLRYQMNLLPDLPISLRIGSRSTAISHCSLQPHCFTCFSFRHSFLGCPSIPSPPLIVTGLPPWPLFPTTQQTINLIKFKLLTYFPPVSPGITSCCGQAQALKLTFPPCSTHG